MSLVFRHVEHLLYSFNCYYRSFNFLCPLLYTNTSSLASQKLLKLAVAYRFAADHYSGNGSGGSIDVKDIADEEEFRMIKDIVVAIVQDYNLLRKELKLDYNENEIKTGIPEL